jgi:hypothetical protein
MYTVSPSLNVRPISRSPQRATTMALLNHRLSSSTSPKVEPSLMMMKPRPPRENTKRRVRFDSKVETHRIPSLAHIKGHKAVDSWYSKRELDEIRKKELRAIQFGRTLGCIEMCLRGLEDQLSRRARMEMQSRKAAVMNAVFREQYYQRCKAIDDPSRIRRRSLAASWDSRQLAFQLADRDATEVREQEGVPSPRRLRKTQSCLDRREGMGTIQVDRSTRNIMVQ